jgi:hypothetical protein
MPAGMVPTPKDEQKKNFEFRSRAYGAAQATVVFLFLLFYFFVLRCSCVIRDLIISQPESARVHAHTAITSDQGQRALQRGGPPLTHSVPPGRRPRRYTNTLLLLGALKLPPTPFRPHTPCVLYGRPSSSSPSPPSSMSHNDPSPPVSSSLVAP